MPQIIPQIKISDYNDNIVTLHYLSNRGIVPGTKVTWYSTKLSTTGVGEVYKVDAVQTKFESYVRVQVLGNYPNVKYPWKYNKKITFRIKMFGKDPFEVVSK